MTRARVGQVVGKYQTRWSKEPAITRVRADIAGIVDSNGGVMLIPEVAEALIVARGCNAEEPSRTAIARAVVRAAVEVERSMGDPRYQIRRDGDRVVVALTQDLAGYAFRLGNVADTLASEDPLVPPQRVLQQLREVFAPDQSKPLADPRLIRLAAAASARSALSSRQELYPIGMGAARALKLSQGAIHGVATLTVEEIRDRVRSRYPEAAPLPDPPALDLLLKEAGFDFEWLPAFKGVGGYNNKYSDPMQVSSATASVVRQLPPNGEIEITPEIADARQFEERLRHGIKEGSFYTLLVNPRYYQRAYQELCRRFPVELVDFEDLFLQALRRSSTKLVPNGKPWSMPTPFQAMRSGINSWSW